MTKTPPKSSKKSKLIRKEWPKIRDISYRGKTLFVVDGRPHQKREYFAKKVEAETRAEQLETERENKGTESLGFSTETRVMAAECAHKLTPYGKTIRDATEHYIAWLISEKHRNESRLLKDCLADYLLARQADVDRKELAKTSMYEIKARLTTVDGALGQMPIMSVTKEKVWTYLDSLPYAARTRINYRLRMSHFFNFCKGKGWIDRNPCEDIEMKAKRGDVSILSIDEVKKVLKAAVASPHASSLVPFAAVSLFAGLRPGEAEQLDWKNVHFNTESIEVLHHTSKTRDTRYVKMDPTLILWLNSHKKKSGRIIEPNHRKNWEEARAAAGDFMKGNVDVLRHTFASYWLALHKNRTELAELMGNSVDVIKKHYRKPILEMVAKEFWAITPKALKKEE